MRTTLILLVLLTVFSISTLAQDFSHIVLEGHKGEINSVAFSPDGNILASGSSDETIRLWDVNTGELLNTFEGHEGKITSVAFSPDGSILASGSNDKTLHVWNANTGELIETLTPHRRTVYCVAFSPDGSILASGGEDDSTHLWNAKAFDPNPEPVLWNLETGKQVEENTPELLLRSLEEYTYDVYSIAFSPDGNILASGTYRDITLWDVNTGERLNTLDEYDDYEGVGHDDEITSVAFSPDGNILASADHVTIGLWDVNTGKLLNTFEEHRSTSVAFSPDGNILAGGGIDGAIGLWDINTGKLLNTFEGHKDTVNSVVFSPDGSLLAGGSSDATVRLWKLPSTHVRITPYPVKAPAIGGQLTVNLSITEGQNVGGYQATVEFDPTALRYVESANGDYLPTGAFFVPPVVLENRRWDRSTRENVSYPTITLGATSLAGIANGHGTLATITFEVLDLKESPLVLSDVILTDSAGEYLPHYLFAGLVIPSQIAPEDVNGDGVINILDLVKVAARFGQAAEGTVDVNRDGIVNIVDLVKVAAALGAGAAAPSLHPQSLAMFTATDVQQWLTQVQHVDLTDATSQRGILFLEQLLAALIPKETTLLANYPNPFNPETWLPYQLAKSADVTLRIYAVDGTVVRTLALGHQSMGIYQDKSRSAYWDGRNKVGEPVASGIYFYTLTAGDFTATRKMLIRK